MRPSAELLYAFRRNLVVAASAGTGKTHSLVGVLVHLLLGASELGGSGLRAPVDPSRIAATTFSRKAAAEIRARIVEELERLAMRDLSAKYRADLRAACARANAVPWTDEQVADRARRALDGIARAQIGTLHGFASTLVRAHALEAGLSPRFEIAGEEDARRRVEDTIVRVLEAKPKDEVRALVDAAFGVDRLVSDIARVLARLEEDGRGASALVVPEDDAHRLDVAMRALVEHARALEEEARFADAAGALLRAWNDLDERALVSAAADFCGLRILGKRSAVAEAFAAFRALLPAPSDAPNAERGRRLARAWLARDAFAGASRAVRDILVQCQDEIGRDVKRTSLLGFGDVLRLARDVLRDRPDVAHEVGRGLDVLLVDEFQDTSRLQRDLVHLVWAREDRRVSGVVPHVGDLRPHGLFVVGDRKQSIYGFRGADVSVFAELCVGLAGAPAREALGISPGSAWEPSTPLADFVSLRHNRRGNAGLLAFANAFSRERFKVREPPAQLFEIEFIPSTEDLLVPPERIGEPLEPRTSWVRAAGDSETTRLDEAHAIANRILAIVSSGQPRVGGNAPSYRDIAVLAPTNEMLDAAAFALAQCGVPHVVAGRGFYSASEVRDLASMLALILDPKDKLALLEVLRGPWVGAHDASLVGLTEPYRGLLEIGPAWDKGSRRELVHDDDKDALSRVRRIVSQLWRNLDRLGPAGVLREAVRELALEEVLVLLPRGEQRVANVRKLIRMAEREVNAVRFLERLYDLIAREVAESEAATFSDEDDAVRLLTVHSSKGLDFPIVFVPQVGLLPRPRERGVMVLDLGAGGAPPTLAVRIADAEVGSLEGPSFVRAIEVGARRDRAERQRLAYVAMTRASEAMILVGDRRPSKTGDNVRYWSTDVSALCEIAATDASRLAGGLVVEELTRRAPSPVSSPADVADGAPLASPEDPRLATPAWQLAAIAPTALQDFAHCPRRFQLMHLLGLPERAPSALASQPTRDEDAQAPRLDARAEGTLAHRILECIPREVFGRPEAERAAGDLLAREGIGPDHEKYATVLAPVVRFASGAYAARAANADAELAREVPFVLRVPDASGRTLALRGSIDLMVIWPDGSVDVIDYKRARGPSPEPYAFQLDVYLLAAGQISPDTRRMRAGIVFLGGDAKEPLWRKSPDPERTRRRLSELAAGLVQARWTETFPRVPPDRCRAIRCGYFRSCHPGQPST